MTSFQTFDTFSNTVVIKDIVDEVTTADGVVRYYVDSVTPSNSGFRFIQDANHAVRNFINISTNESNSLQCVMTARSFPGVPFVTSSCCSKDEVYARIGVDGGLSIAQQAVTMRVYDWNGVTGRIIYDAGDAEFQVADFDTFNHITGITFVAGNGTTTNLTVTINHDSLSAINDCFITEIPATGAYVFEVTTGLTSTIISIGNRDGTFTTTPTADMTFRFSRKSPAFFTKASFATLGTTGSQYTASTVGDQPHGLANFWISVTYCSASETLDSSLVYNP